MKRASRADRFTTESACCKPPNMSQRLTRFSWRLTRTDDSSCDLSLREDHSKWISVFRCSRKNALTVFLASALAVVVLQPLPALGQSGCDPSTSFCGGAHPQTASRYNCPVLQNHCSGCFDADGENPTGRVAATWGALSGNYTGPSQSMDLQPVPNYTDNLGSGAAAEGTNARFLSPLLSAILCSGPAD